MAHEHWDLQKSKKGCMLKITKITNLAKPIIAGTFVAIALFTNSCAATESTSEIRCEALGDAIIATNTGELILEQRMVKFKALEEYGRNTTGRRGGQRAICTIKNDPPGYRWVSCGKDGDGYIGNGNNINLLEVEEAVANQVQYRGWSGACKVKL